MNITELYQCFLQCDGVSIDTRNITQNSLFFALKGENFDANKFAQQALDKGALFVIMDNKALATDPDKMIVVPNVLGALQQLAKYHRQQLGLPIIALTGSNGKTTTKELITAVLAQKYTTQSTLGNLNNHIGVPLTLLSLSSDTDLGVIEIGANHKNEISFLCELIDPDFGYITNFGKAHLEGFGDFQGVIKAKSELYDYLEDHHKMAFINLDDPIQDAKTITFPRYTFGQNQDASVVFENYCSLPNAQITYRNQKIDSNLTGIYNATNIAAAVAIGLFFDVALDSIKQAIEHYTPTNNRSQWVNIAKAKVLLDAYNANPSSMKAAIDNFIALDVQKNKVCILGDMYELGTYSNQEHLQIVEELNNQADISGIYIGKEFYKHKDKAKDNHHFFASFEDFEKDQNLIDSLKNKTILVKGSRAMALERTLELLK
ncbi:UDP-N-acetylmuramoyl-tripeptide--D-alanyl-D-alanine ligase [Myroides sp. LJL115]